MSDSYDRLRHALERFNEDPDRGGDGFYAAVWQIVRAHRRSLAVADDAYDVCQQVALSMLRAMEKHNRVVIDVIPMVPTIVRRRIADHYRKESSQKPPSAELAEGETLEEALQVAEHGFGDIEDRTRWEKHFETVRTSSERSYVALVALYEGHDVHAALVERFGPMTKNNADQILHRAKKQLAAAMRGEAS